LTSIQQGQATDPLSAGHISRLQSSEQADVPPNAKPDPWSLGEDGKTLLYRQRTYVPDHNDIRLDILRSLHDHQLAGHPGITKTMKSIRRQYHWPHMATFVTDYIGSCSKCRHAKSIHHKPFGPLRFLPIGERPWDSISMDFIEGLPLSDGHDMILVIVDRLTKMALFIPTFSDIDAGEVAMLFLRYVFAKHGTPSDIISDRGKHFTSRFWTSLCELLGIKGNLSTAYHPQTDGQTERVNQILEQYLRVYINYQQDDWVNLLPLAEFAYNNTAHSATQVTPFFANKGFHPKLEVSLTSVASEDAYRQSVDLKDLHQYLRDQISKSITQYTSATTTRRLPIPEFRVGDKVWLDSRNIRTKRPSKKLDHRRLGPYPITAKISSHAFRLGLPLDLRQIHPVFHVSLLEPATLSNISGRHPDPPPPIEIDSENEYEVANILDSRIRRKRLEYLVQWKGYEDTDQATSWEPFSNVTNATRKLSEFHATQPNKPRK
jgi:hypothetical protein